MQCKYTQLRIYIYAQRPNGLKVCPKCWDVDNLQLIIGQLQVPEAIALYKPRPDTGDRVFGRGYAGYRPAVGSKIGVTLNAVTVN